MGMQIQDGTGTGYQAKVTTSNRLLVEAVSKTEEHLINESTGKVWSIPFEGLNPAGADDYVVYIKNTGDVPLEITSMRLMADTAATQVEVHAVSGTAAGGSAITPVSRTVGSAATPDATIESGTDITGLTNDGILFFVHCSPVDQEQKLSVGSTIVIPKGKAIALLVEVATANLTGVISINEE